MKTLPGALAAHVALDSTTLGYLLRVTRTDAQVFGFTSADLDVVIGGVTYRAAPGLDVSSLAMSSGFAVDNLELTTLDDGSVFSKVDVLNDVWRGARFLISRYNWASPTDGTEPLCAGTVGNVRLSGGKIVAEFRGLQQAFQQPIGSPSSKTCRARLGDAKCRVNLASYTVSGTVTAAASAQQFTDTGRTEPADWFGDGLITWLTGANAGVQRVIATHATGGVLTTSVPMFRPIVVGDTYSLSAGCRKRLAEDCAGKFSNVLNFQGEPHRPTLDRLTKGGA